MSLADEPTAEAAAAATGRQPVNPAAVYLSSALLSLFVAVMYLQVWAREWTSPFDPRGGYQQYIVEQILYSGAYQGADPTRSGMADGFSGGFDHPLHVLAVHLLSLVSDNPAVALNLLFLLGFPLAGLAATAFLRKVGLIEPRMSWPVVALATLFALAPYHFLQGMAAAPLAWYWPLPLGLCVALGVLRRERIWSVPTTGSAATALLFGQATRTAAAVVLVALSGSDYAAFIALLLIAAALGGAARRSTEDRPWRPARFGAAASAVALLWLVRMLSGLVAGPNDGEQAWSDVATTALKPIALLLPAPGHPLAFLAGLRHEYDTEFSFPTGTVALGLVATVGFLWLLALPLVRAIGPDRARPPLVSGPGRVALSELSALTWVAFAFGIFGGFAVLDGFGRSLTGQVHVWNRISIVIAMLALAGVGLVLRGVVDRVGDRAGTEFGLRLPLIAAVVVLLIGVADQHITSATPALQPPVAGAVAANTGLLSDLGAGVR